MSMLLVILVVVILLAAFGMVWYGGAHRVLGCSCKGMEQAISGSRRHSRVLKIFTSAHSIYA
jgi:hypothetical protein